jgi:dipeptidyl aminopeptidase/acylaminoacyl peptidase
MSFERLFADQRMGDDRAYLHDRSPVNFVQNIRVPLLNAYGYNDARVDIRQWKLLEPKLKEFKKTYEILIEDDEGHGFRNEANRIAFYK